MSNFLIFSKPDCPNCDKAAFILSQAGHDYIKFVMGEEYSVDDLLRKIKESGGKPPRSVPQIFLDEDGIETYIGGLPDLQRFLESQ